MASEEVILSTIQRMKASGIPDSIISSTLDELGVSPEQVQKYLQQAPIGGVSQKTAGESEDSAGQGTAIPGLEEGVEGESENPLEGLEEEAHERIASATAEKVKEHLDAHQEQAEYNQTVVHSSLEEQKLLIAQLHELVNQLHEKFDATNLQSVTNQVNALQKKTDALYQMQSETKALMQALQSLMQKILETTQQLAFESRKGK
ncbi:MAG: hypothetical protein HY393_01240 [Candidatus Diapherotrites archaeon]|nr:hypothetical protein [Candidatus Diapherotrites archaeon]